MGGRWVGELGAPNGYLGCVYTIRLSWESGRLPGAQPDPEQFEQICAWHLGQVPPALGSGFVAWTL